MESDELRNLPHVDAQLVCARPLGATLPPCSLLALLAVPELLCGVIRHCKWMYTAVRVGNIRFQSALGEERAAAR